MGAVGASGRLASPSRRWRRQRIGAPNGSGCRAGPVANARRWLLALGALIFTALNFDLLRRNTQRNYEQAEQGQVTDRYTKAIEQLGSDRLDAHRWHLRPGTNCRDSARDHPTVMEALSAFVREHSREQGFTMWFSTGETDNAHVRWECPRWSAYEPLDAN